MISLLHATYGRPEKALKAMRRTWARMKNHHNHFQYIFAVNETDTATLDALRKHREEHDYVPFQFVTGDFAGSAPAWDAAAKASMGDLLIQVSDDLELPSLWDVALLSRLYEFDNYWDTKKLPIFVAVSDGFRKDDLCTCAIMTRARYEQAGEFLCPKFYSVYSDDDVTYRSLRDERDGKCHFLNARDIVFTHRHHLHDATVPNDPTYMRGNSPEAYRLGAELFAHRNPEAATDGLRTWG